MTKIQILALIAVVIALFGVTAGIVLKEALLPQTFGAQPDSSVDTVASSSASYFAGCAGCTGTAAYTPTATTTLLTINNVEQGDTIEIVATVTATTTPAGGNFFVVDTSQDASTWYPIMIEAVTTTGPQVGRVELLATSTVFNLVPAVGTVVRAPILKVRNVAAKYLRVRAWTSASSTILVTGNKLSQ